MEHAHEPNSDHTNHPNTSPRDDDKHDFLTNYNRLTLCLAANTNVLTWIVICIGSPLTLLAIYSLCLLVKKDHLVAVFVINLLISDLIQICCLIFWVTEPTNSIVISYSTVFYLLGLLASVAFMVCVALERYLVVAWPLWYRCKRGIKRCVIVTVMVWVSCFIESFVVLLIPSPDLWFISHVIFLLLPFPVLIFCLAGTLKSLSSAISVTLKEKWRIICTLVLVLFNYTGLFLPWVIWILLYRHSSEMVQQALVYKAFLQFSPLADLILYVFMGKGAVDKVLATLSCCRVTREEEQGQVTPTNVKNTEEVNSV